MTWLAPAPRTNPRSSPTKATAATGPCACPTAWACPACIMGGIAEARAAHGEEEATSRADRHKAHKADILRTTFERRAAKIQANREKRRSET